MRTAPVSSDLGYRRWKIRTVRVRSVRKTEEKRMRPYLRLLSLALLGSGLAPLITVCASYYALHTISVRFLITIAVIAVLVLALTVLFDRALIAFEPRLDRHARDQAVFLRSFPDRYVRLAVFGSAALSLFLELAIIRWQGTVFSLLYLLQKLFSVVLLCRTGPWIFDGEPWAHCAQSHYTTAGMAVRTDARHALRHVRSADI